MNETRAGCLTARDAPPACTLFPRGCASDTYRPRELGAGLPVSIASASASARWLWLLHSCIGAMREPRRSCVLAPGCAFGPPWS